MNPTPPTPTPHAPGVDLGMSGRLGGNDGRKNTVDPDYLPGSGGSVAARSTGGAIGKPSK